MITNVEKGPHLKLRAFLKNFEPGTTKPSKEGGIEKSAFPRHVNIVFENDTRRIMTADETKGKRHSIL